MQRLYNVQALRGLAAMMVVLAHLKVPLLWVNDSPTAPLTHGQAGVDVFFLISGFIMANGLRDSVDSPIAFLRRRLIRIVPLYWLVTGLVFVAATVAPRLFPQVSADFPHLIKSLLFVPQEKSPIVYVGWTLNFEMLFYVLLTFGLCAGGVYRFAVPTLVIITFVLIGAADVGRGEIWNFLTDQIMLEFVAGIGLGLIWDRLRGPTLLLAIGLVLSVAAVFTGPYPDGARWLRLVDWGVPALGIMVFTLALEAKGLAVKWRPLQIAGDASYAIYLSHFFITRVYEKFPMGVDLRAHPAVAFATSAFVLAAVVAAGVAIHFLVEKPLSAAVARIWPTTIARSVLTSAQ